MEYVYAALLLHKVQKEINEASVKKVITATGTKADDVKVKALVSALGEVDIEEALKNATMAPTVAAATAEAAPAQEEKKEEPKEEKKEEALDGLSSLFG